MVDGCCIDMSLGMVIHCNSLRYFLLPETVFPLGLTFLQVDTFESRNQTNLLISTSAYHENSAVHNVTQRRACLENVLLTLPIIHFGGTLVRLETQNHPGKYLKRRLCDKCPFFGIFNVTHTGLKMMVDGYPPEI